MATEQTARRLRLLDGLLVFVVLLFAFLTALFPVYNSDFFLHAATGRLIAHGHYQIGVDPFAFTTQGAVWINHHWLYDLIVYLLYASSTAGGTILIVLKALMIAALAEVMLRTAREPGRSLWIPAACVGLAVLTLSPRVFLQPVCVSFFFFGLTLWLLHLPRQLRARTETNPSPQRPFLPYWLIPPLCLLWVNFDEWFLLGPATVALYLLGETLQDWFGPANTGVDSPAPGERRALLLVLLASVVVCLVNPHHVGAFALPSSLGVGEAVDAVRIDPQFRALFLSPFEGSYFYPFTGLSAAGLAYFPLAVLGVVSFAAAQWVGRWRWGRALLWAAFFALSMWHARAIPFFAVVAGPIASLNFLDFAAKRFGLAPRRGSWALGGRILTLLAGLILVALSWPGWLQAQPWEMRRVGWNVTPNPALKQMAEQITAWQKDGLIEPRAHWLNTAPDALYYLAWYCPGERAFIDNQRLSLYDRTTAEDFAVLRKSLAREGGDAASADPKWRKVLGVHDAHLLIWYEGHPFPLLPASPLPTLLSAPKEWPLLYTNGRAAVFGWRGQPKELTADPFARLEFDSNKAAFGPDAVTAPAEPPQHKPREWWSAYWTPEAPRPPEADETALQWLRFEVLAPLWRERNEKKWDAHWEDIKRKLRAASAVACFGLGNLAGGALEIEVVHQALAQVKENSPMPSMPPRPGEELQYSVAQQLFDFGPPDALYLGIRAGRRAIAAKPDDAPTYQYLAQNYMTLAQQTREGARAGAIGYPLLLRRVQIAAALRRALDSDPNLEPAHALSAQLYLETGFLDLAKDHAEKRQMLLLQSADAPTRRQAEAMSKEIAKLGKEVAERQTTYQLHAAGQPVLGKVKAAQELGLGQTALDALEKVDWDSFDKDDPNKALGVQKEMTLMMQTGRAEEVGKALVKDEQNLKDGLGVDPDTGLPAYEWLRVQVAAAIGEYAGADRWLKAIQEKTRRAPRLVVTLQQLGLLGTEPAEVADLEPSALTALMAGRLILREAPSAGGASWLRSPLPDARSMLLATAEVIAEPLNRQSDLDAVRGWLALEAGRTADARDRFNDALRHASPGDLPFRGRLLTELDLEWLDAAK
ncbi:MAG TPA: hypothetical protein DDY78_03575 [Planctomycetales bacterium]|jgi:hypothetical protein|nr:hypothetical protein [Planctomycetales bacterium]